MQRHSEGLRRLTRIAIAGIALAAPGCGTGGDEVGGSPSNPGPGVPAPPTTPGTPPAVGRPGLKDERTGGMGSGASATAPGEIQKEPSPFRFEDATASSGVDFVHVSGMTAEKYYPTANGSGVALLDYDGDGDMDLYFANGTNFPVGSSQTGPNRLFQNLGGGKFRDATEESGLGFSGYCHGIIVSDVDNDGDQDVFLANYGRNALYLNDGHGKFIDVTESAGIDRPGGWSSSGAFLDYDNDGDLDLYVSRYGEWKLPEDDRVCIEGGIRLYCSPKSIRTVRHVFYRNEWKETGKVAFTEVTEEAGLARDDGHGFGVVTGDFDGDGKVDIYVANDMNPNFLYLNKGDGTFTDATDTSGTAYDKDGRTQSSMGIEAEDIDGDADGLPELFVTNFQNEYNTLYQNMGGGNFVDQTAFFNLAASSLPWVGWGCALMDFDNDGWPDCFVANGHVDDNRRKMSPPQPVDEEEPALLLKNEGGTRFRLATREAGSYFDARHTGRGAAFGDLDDDGLADIVVNHRGNPAAVLLNRTPSPGKWVRLKLVGTKSNRDAVGAKVEVEVKGRVIHRFRKSGASMMSSNDPRLLIGVGDTPEVVRVTVRWPSGLVTNLANVAMGKTLEIVEGQDAPASSEGAR